MSTDHVTMFPLQRVGISSSNASYRTRLLCFTSVCNNKTGRLRDGNSPFIGRLQQQISALEMLISHLLARLEHSTSWPPHFHLLFTHRLILPHQLWTHLSLSWVSGSCVTHQPQLTASQQDPVVSNVFIIRL